MVKVNKMIGHPLKRFSIHFSADVLTLLGITMVWEMQILGYVILAPIEISNVTKV